MQKQRDLTIAEAKRIATKQGYYRLPRCGRETQVFDGATVCTGLDDRKRWHRSEAWLQNIGGRFRLRWYYSVTPCMWE